MAEPGEVEQNDPLAGLGFDPSPALDQSQPQIPAPQPLAGLGFDEPTAKPTAAVDPLADLGFDPVETQPAADPLSDLGFDAPETTPEQADPLAGLGFDTDEPVVQEQPTSIFKAFAQPVQEREEEAERTQVRQRDSVSRSARNRILDLRKELEGDLDINRRQRVMTQLERLENLQGELDAGIIEANTAAASEDIRRKWYVPAREMLGGLTLGIGDNIFEAIEENNGGKITAETSTESIVSGISEAFGMVMSGRAIAGGLSNVIKTPNALKKMILLRGGTAAIQGGVSAITDVVDGNITAKEGAANLAAGIFSSLVPIIPENMIKPGAANFLGQVATDLATDVFTDTFFRDRLKFDGSDNWKEWIASEIPNLALSVFFAGQDLTRPRNEFQFQQETVKSDAKRAFRQLKAKAQDVFERGDIAKVNEDFSGNAGRVHGEMNDKIKKAVIEGKLTDDEAQRLTNEDATLFSNDAIKAETNLPDGWKVEVVSKSDMNRIASKKNNVEPEELGDVRGMVDRNKKTVFISEDGRGVDKFEAALHEAGHAFYNKEVDGPEGQRILDLVQRAVSEEMDNARIESELGILPETVAHMKMYLNKNLFNKRDLAEEAFVAEKSLREFNDGLKAKLGKATDKTPALDFQKLSDDQLVRATEERPEVVTQRAVDDVETIAKEGGDPSRAVEVITKVQTDGVAPGVKPEGDLPPVKNTDAEIPGTRELTAEERYRKLQDEGLAREDLGRIARTPEARAILNEADARRNEQGQPGVRTREEVQAEAKRIFDDDQDAQIDRILTGNNGMKTDTDAELARLAFDEQVRRSMESNSREDDAKASQIAMNIRQAGTEIARALAERRMPSDPVDYNRRMLMGLVYEPDAKLRKKIKDLPPEKQLEMLMNNNGKNKAEEALRKAGIDIRNLSRNDLSDPILTAQIARIISTARSSGLDMAYEWWINGILSSPATHMANIMGNTVNAVWEFGPQRFTEGALNAIWGPIKGSQKKRAEGRALDEGLVRGSREFKARVNKILETEAEATIGELGAAYKAIFPAFWQGLRNAVKTFSAERPVFQGRVDGDGPSKLEVDSRTAKIPGRFGRIVRIPSRSLVAVDIIAKTVVSQMEVAAQAYRIAKAKTGGGTSAEFQAEVRRQMENPASEAWSRAAEKADELTFQNMGEPGTAFAKGQEALLKARQVPFVRYILPFVTTPLNIARIGFNKSPVSILKAIVSIAKGKGGTVKGNKEAAEALLSLTSLVLLTGLMEEDEDGRPRITGTFEGDSINERKFRNQNIPSQSVRIGDRWVKYNRIEPIGTTLALTIDMFEAAKDTKSGQDPQAFKKVFAGLKNTLKDKTFLKGIGDIIKAMEDENKAFNYAKNFAGSWTPNWLRAGMRNADPFVRESKIREKNAKKVAIMQGKRIGQSALPLKDLAPPARVDIWGRPIEKGQIDVNPGTDWLFQMFSPVQLRKADTFTDIDRAILNYNNRLPEGAKGWWPSQPSGTITLGGKTVVLDEDLYFEYATRSGQLAGELAQKVVDKIDVLNPRDSDIKLIGDMITRGRAIARAEFIKNHRELFR